MPVMKKTILYSLFIVNSVNFSLHSQDLSLPDHEDLLLVFDGSADEMYPLEDADTVCLMPEIQNYVDALELDPTMQTDFAIEAVIQENIETKVEPKIILDVQNDLLPIDESMALALQDIAQDSIIAAPEIIVASDNDLNVVQQELEAEQAITSQPITIINDLQSLVAVEPIVQAEQDSIEPISKDQLEALLQNQCEQCDLIEQYFADLVPVQVSLDDNCSIISCDNEDLVSPVATGISFASHSQDPVVEITEDDDIVPVPHDLINSVKKANKLKKKLEKKARKEKASFFKKSKKANKKK